MLSRLNEVYANKKELLGFLTENNQDGFNFIIVNSSTEKILASIAYKSENAQTLIDDLLSTDNLFKACIIDLFKLDLPYNEISYNYCEELQKIFLKKEIPNSFINEKMLVFATYLIATNISVEFDDTVLFVMTHSDETENRSIKTFAITMVELKSTRQGFKLINCKEHQSLNIETSPKILQAQICEGFSKPRFVIIPTYQCSKLIAFKKIFKSYNAILINQPVENYYKEFIIQSSKWLLDKSYVKYHIMPVCDRDLNVFGYFGTDNNILEIFEINTNDTLPITKKSYHSRSIPRIRLFFETEMAKFGNEERLPPFCHGYETTVTIDENNFDKTKISSLYLQDFGKLPTKLDKLLPSKIPFIGFFDNLSFTAISKDKNGYDFIKGWNGIYGNDCIISFNQKKPQFGFQALEKILMKNSSVVFDLIKIMSMPSDDIKIDKTWGFEVAHYPEYPVLLEFDFCGKTSGAPPAFLMAMCIRQQLEAIKAEIGENPEEIALWIAKQKYNDEEYKRIKEGLAESCRLLKLGYFFVDLESYNPSLTTTPYDAGVFFSKKNKSVF